MVAAPEGVAWEKRAAMIKKIDSRGHADPIFRDLVEDRKHP
jgi:hypothetical protein